MFFPPFLNVQKQNVWLFKLFLYFLGTWFLERPHTSLNLSWCYFLLPIIMASVFLDDEKINPASRKAKPSFPTAVIPNRKWKMPEVLVSFLLTKAPFQQRQIMNSQAFWVQSALLKMTERKTSLQLWSLPLHPYFLWQTWLFLWREVFRLMGTFLPAADKKGDMSLKMSSYIFWMMGTRKCNSSDNHKSHCWLTLLRA